MVWFGMVRYGINSLEMQCDFKIDGFGRIKSHTTQYHTILTVLDIRPVDAGKERMLLKVVDAVATHSHATGT